MCRLESWILSIIPYRNQLFCQQGHHIYGVFLRPNTEKDSIDVMSLLTKELKFTLYSYFVFPFSMFVGMEVTQSDRIFQLTERPLNGPSGIV